MTTDVRTLLHDAAEAPSRAPDIDAARRRARERRRRRSGLGALVAVTVVALATGAFAVANNGGGDDGHVAIGLRQSATDVPEGWKQIQADPGITMAIPPGWASYDFGHTDVAVTRLAVGTSPDLPDGTAACATDGPAVPGTWVNVWEYAPSSATAMVRPIDPNGGGGAAGVIYPVTDRPETFSRANWRGGGCPGGTYRELAFRDAGRVFVARISALVAPDGDTTPPLRLAEQVLDTLRVEPLVAETTTSLEHTGSIPPTTTTPTTPTTTTPPGNLTPTDDEKLISQAFIVWMDDQSDAGLDASVEDPDAVRVPSHAGWDQHTAVDLAQYEGRVESVQLTDADHAQVVYTILHDGQVAFSKRLGSAVRVDGQWKVSTETVCGMLALGGVTCPA